MTSTTIIDSFELKLKTCVREVAGKRKVFSAKWQNKNVFVKIFLHTDSAERHWKRDVDGILLFNKKGILSPALLWSGKFPAIKNICSDNAFGIILEAIPDAEAFSCRWENSNDKTRLVKKAVEVIAGHHKAGLIQRDLHFGNFLFSGNLCYSLDGDALHEYELTPIEKAAENYALLTAQAEVIHENLFAEQIAEYCKLTSYDSEKFTALFNRFLMPLRKTRCHNLLKKIYRDCTAINTYNSPGRRSFIQSKFDSPELRKCIDNPESFFPKDKKKLLKNGNSATVALINVNGQDLVVKRYNYSKNIKTFIRRFRKSRASISWSNAFRLLNYGLKTPEPYALVETFKGPMIEHAYFIAEHIHGEDLLNFYKHSPSDEKALNIAGQMKDIFAVWKQCKIAHGDCKATNFILHNERVFIIDLDAMHEMNSLKAFNKAHKKDIKRWMKNWEEDQALTDLFKSEFRL